MTSAEVSPIAAPQDGSSSQDHWQQGNSSRKSRFPRACTARTSARLQEALPSPERPFTPADGISRREKEDQQRASRIVTPLLQPPAAAQLPRWTVRSMWELASLLNFLNVFRPLLNISVEFSADELETALITPNSTLDDIHIPLLRAIPPVTRMALGRATWVTVLCRKLKDWWHWVAEGEIPIVASHGTEVDKYNNLEPTTRVLILKALCDIRVEQEDIRNYIEDSLKHGIQLSAFRKDRIGGDSHGVSYWYEDDSIIGHRLYREIRNVEVKKSKGKVVPAPPHNSYHWEAIATNLDEFQEVSSPRDGMWASRSLVHMFMSLQYGILLLWFQVLRGVLDLLDLVIGFIYLSVFLMLRLGPGYLEEKLLESKNRTELSLAKKLKIDILPELSSLLVFMNMPTNTFADDYDRSINEALKITQNKQSSPENDVKREPVVKPDFNSRIHCATLDPLYLSLLSPNPIDNEEGDEEVHAGSLDRSRRRKRPQRYSEKEYVEAISDNEAEFDSNDDIVGEAVYDDEYLRSQKQQVLNSSDGDEEYHWEDNTEDEEDDDKEESLSISEESDGHSQYKKLRSRSRCAAKLRSVDELQAGLRRSKRSTRSCINYQQYEISETDEDSGMADKSTASDAVSDAINDLELSTASQGSEEDEEDNEEMKNKKLNSGQLEETAGNVPHRQAVVAQADSLLQEGEGLQTRRFLDLNELAPGTGFDDVSCTVINDKDDKT
ncbi:hypothetical protein AXF42_Ash014317 [Apostasia shenzhenica]|uniref:DDT domain-containing protein n=1 Tax=Apostasia shenzhenica TaxID=1088818 RepID=A0A2I0B0T6_9ASPA|nr:hypothetical protein AXF42_Ash014317 [Apostasia shenzhenica]